ncbi:MAG: hypothetical protein QG671_299 [Actinomycetota bacterium]|nr:hypothetical protein [Actinomycetota bacterium]
MPQEDGSARAAPTSPRCRRCGEAVEANAADYDVFEQMHYVCFHYEFEHQGDPDVECDTGGCPAAGIHHAARFVRTDGVNLTHAANALVPAILALESSGYTVTQDGTLFVATAGNARFSAEDPVSLLGLVRLAELRRPWRATDAEIDATLDRFDL